MTERSNTPALDRATRAGYCRTDTDECCSVCRYSFIQEYYPSGTKFLCGRLNIQTHEDYRCNYFDRFVKVGSEHSCGATELEPCPFCKSPPRGPWLRDWENSYSAYCPVCGCIGPSASSEEEAISLWNRRVSE